MSITKEELENAIATSLTMSEAAGKLKLHFSTFKRYAEKECLYRPNRGGKGTSKPKVNGKLSKIPLSEIINGLHPQYQTYKLKHRLFEAGIKTNICENCNISEWNGLPLSLELDHIDGDRTNHRLNNLKILCPNCHSQTDTFRFKRGKGT